MSFLRNFDDFFQIFEIFEVIEYDETLKMEFSDFENKQNLKVKIFKFPPGSNLSNRSNLFIFFTFQKLSTLILTVNTVIESTVQYHKLIQSVINVPACSRND